MMKSLLLASSAITLCCVGQPALATDSVRAPVTFPTSLPHAYYSVQAQQATAANVAAALSGNLPASQVTGTVSSAASLTGTLPGTQVTGTVPAAAEAAAVTGPVAGNQITGQVASAAAANTATAATSVTGQVNGAQIFGNIDTTGTITGQALVGTGTIVSQGNVFATGPIWSTTGVGTNGDLSAGSNITAVYGNISTTWGGFVGNLYGTATAALTATTANQAYGLTTGATVAGSQVLGPVGSATYATSSGSSTTTQYALVSGHSSNYQTLNIAVAASGVNPTNLSSNTAQCQAAGFSGSPIACAGTVSNGIEFFSQSIGGNTYYYSETISSASTGGNSDSGGGNGAGGGASQ